MTHTDGAGQPSLTGREAPPHPSPVLLFEHQGWRAGIVTRCVANVIDLVVTLAALASIYLGVSAVFFLWNPRGFRFPTPGLAVTIVVGSCVAAVYFAVAWMVTGRTYGDYVLGVRVVARDGHRLHPGVALVRAAACVAFPIGLVWVGLSEQNRSVQDIFLRTAVIYDWQDGVPPPD